MKNPLSCIVIDDCDLDRKSVELELLNHNDLNIIGSFNNCIEALSFYNRYQPDVLFVDIDMPEVNGLEFIKSLNNSESVNVIISSHAEYALEGFQLKVFDFILKPLETERFDGTINRIRDFIQLKNKAEAYDVLFEQEQIVFKDGLTTIKLNVFDIIYLEAFGDYTKIVTDKKVHLTLATLSKFLSSLPVNKFVRIHRSYVVSINRIKAFNAKQVDMGCNLLAVGKTYLKETKKIFNGK